MTDQRCEHVAWTRRSFKSQYDEPRWEVRCLFCKTILSMGQDPIDDGYVYAHVDDASPAG